MFYFTPNGLSVLWYQPTRHVSVKPCNCNFSEFITLAIVGGFQKDEAQTAIPYLDVSNHEEADTCLILHCVYTSAYNVVVTACDTDVLVLTVAYYHKKQCSKIRMKAGTCIFKHQN